MPFFDPSLDVVASAWVEGQAGHDDAPQGLVGAAVPAAEGRQRSPPGTGHPKGRIVLGRLPRPIIRLSSQRRDRFPDFHGVGYYALDPPGAWKDELRRAGLL